MMVMGQYNQSPMVIITLLMVKNSFKDVFTAVD